MLALFVFMLSINCMSCLLRFRIQSRSTLFYIFASLFLSVPLASCVCNGQQLRVKTDCVLPATYKQGHEGRWQCLIFHKIILLFISIYLERCKLQQNEEGVCMWEAL